MTAMSDATILPTPADEQAAAVPGEIAYIAHTDVRPRYYANDHSRDVLTFDRRTVAMHDARPAADRPTLDREGFALVDHVSAIKDYRDTANVAAVYPGEIRQFLLDLTGADEVVVNGTGVLRFGERSGDSGKLDNSNPARFVHIDVSDATAAAFAARSAPGDRPIARWCHYNVWRTFSGAPQDVPLAVCDARTITADDLIKADAVFDVAGKPDWSFEGYVIAANPDHRWSYFRDMTPDEVLVFKTNDSDPARAHNVPHCAFDDPGCPDGVSPRASIEMRGIAYWFEA